VTTMREVPAAEDRSRVAKTWNFWQQNERLRRLAGCVLAALTLALMMGPSGTLTSPTHGFTGSWFTPKVLVFLAGGVVLWALMEGRGAVASFTARASASAQSIRRFDRAQTRYALYAVVLVLAIILPRGLSNFWQEVLVDQIGVYVLLAIGLNVVVGFAGLLDLGYIAFYAIGAYSCAFWTGALPLKPPLHLNPFVTIVCAVLLAMIAGVILGAPTLRLRGDYLAIVTLGFGEIITIFANNLTSITGGAQGSNPVPHFSVNLLGIHYKWRLANLPYYYLLLAFVVIILVMFRSLENSKVGRAWTAIREDEVAAEASGINTYKYKLMAFAIGASTSGFAGVLFASKIQTVTPASFVLQQSILVLVFVIFGGMGSLPGALIGAAVLQWAPNFLRNHFQKQDLFLFLGALLVIMMIYRPQGVVPSRRRSRELGLAEAGVGTADAMSAPIAGEIQ
jgi:branched-chain amino acid transport system permease protein